MDKNYLSHIAEAKIRYHKSLAEIPYEEKLRIIIELQKIDLEMSKNNKKRGGEDKFRWIWKIDGLGD